MSVKTWIGNAHDVKQIYTITVAGTWAAADTATLTINTKDIIVTCGSTTTTTATVATALKEAWMSATRMDGTSSSSNATSNFGGQEFGEFSEATASVSGSVVTIIGNKAGKPFTVSLAETAAGSLTPATPQAATGKEFWDNADNWLKDDLTLEVPTNDDTVVFRDSNVSCRYGLPTALEVTIQQWMSYTGEVGLPAINVDEPGKPYWEYRQRYVRLTDAGTGTDIAHRFGLGKDGTGCRLFNLKHSTLKCSPIVYNTASPLASRVGTKALNICCTAVTSTLDISAGSVDWSSQDGSTAAFVTVRQNGGDTRGIAGLHTTGATATISAGVAVIGGSGAAANINARGGVLCLLDQSGTITNLAMYDGSTVLPYSLGTISDFRQYGGTWDAREGGGRYTLTAASVYGGKYLDPFRRTIVGSSFDLYLDPSPNFVFGASIGDSLTIAL